jgi:hypothetical protein
MSIGNLKTQGNKHTNYPWQLKMLKGQQCACEQLTAIVSNTDDVEFLLTSILNTLQASTEYEAKFAVDTCNGDVVYLEVRVWNSDTSTWGPITYYIPGSDTAVIPTGASTPGCLQYTDPGAILALILAELQGQTTLLTDIEADTTSIDATLTSILTAYSAGQQACASSLSVTLCTEQEAEIIDQGTTLDNIETNTTGLATEATLQVVETNTTGVARTPGIIRPSNASGDVNTAAATFYSVSVANVGLADGTVLGVQIKPGEILNFSADALNNFFTSFAYDATGTEFIIIYVA